jgi:hypothetical protein
VPGHPDKILGIRSDNELRPQIDSIIFLGRSSARICTGVTGEHEPLQSQAGKIPVDELSCSARRITPGAMRGN